MNPIRRCTFQRAAFALALLALPALGQADELERGFGHPPDSAKPWVYWFPLNGNITSNGITLDLEAMQRAGIGGVLYMEVDQGAPKGPADFAGPLWRELYKHLCAEANRLGLEVNMNNDAGWCGSGGPWITPELSMQKVVWSETHVEGPRRFEDILPQPPVVANFYRDIAVLAFPTPENPARIENIKGKAAFAPLQVSLAAPANWPSVSGDRTLPRERMIVLTKQMDANGRLTWDVPAGKWTILRFGHTTTGRVNHPAPEAGRGLECDKLSREAAEVHFNGLMGKLIADVGPLAGKTLVSTHIDSWEVGVQNWTPDFGAQFRQRRGYDLLRFLPVLTGCVVESVEISERFLWDLRQTISELLLENYAGHFRDLAHRHGLRLSIEAYHTCPTDEMAYAGRADEPMGEFWSWSKYGAAFSCTEMASAAHVYGKRIVGAEAFTATSAEKWLGHPGNIKDLGDWAFCEGINRFVFHRYALQPWADVRPGMSMGPWGLHYERTQTWWEQSKSWHEYLARCQYLLQQGLFVADICLLSPEGSPQSLNGQRAFRGRGGGPLERPGYNFDTCPPEVILTRMSVRDGRLVLPDGMSYRLLVLPQVETMTPQLLRKIRELVESGATVVGARPLKSPSLSNYPDCDREVARLADQLWGAGTDSAELVERRHGEGRVISGSDVIRIEHSDPEAPSPLASAKWIWRQEGSPAASVPVGSRYFRRIFVADAGSPVVAARLTMTADNSFECWINGRRAGAGDNFARTYTMNVAPLLKPGSNMIAVEAVNATDHPNPAGLIASLLIRYRNGRTQVVPTDKSWEVATTVARQWTTDSSAGPRWAAAMEVGPLGMDPWGDVEQQLSSPDLYPDIDGVCRLLKKMGVPPDFACQTGDVIPSLRYIHRRIGDTDVYFVANKNPRFTDAVCSFRVQGKRPELWWPDTGRIERPALYDVADGCTRLPIRLEPSGSVFVVFRPDDKLETARVVSVIRDGATILDAHWRDDQERIADHGLSLSNTFTFAAWLKPQADTTLLREANSGLSGYSVPRNDALFPPPGHEVYGDPEQAGCGLAAGRNGVCVFEHSADYFAPVLVHAVPLTNWTHAAVAYEKGRPSLYLDGHLVHTGLRSRFTVHPGVGVDHSRAVAPFRGELGEFKVFNRALSAEEILQVVQSMPRPAGRRQHVQVMQDSTAALVVRATESGDYTLRLASGQSRQIHVDELPAPMHLTGPWQVRFDPRWGGPAAVRFDRLDDWTQRSEPGIRFYSGSATYAKTFTIPEGAFRSGQSLLLDLGKVAVMAGVRLNGKDLGIVWKSPFVVEITDAAKPGENALEVRVVNLWVNRQIGDEHLPEDSSRNPNGTLKEWPAWLQEGKSSPTGRYTFTSWKLWKKDDPLQESGLLGPVKITAVRHLILR